MSGRAMGWAKAQRASSVTAKAVLICLADYADEDGVAWPRVATLAEEVQASVRTVQRALRTLEEDGLVAVNIRRRQDHGYSSNGYTLAMTPGVNLTPPLVTECHPPGDTSDTTPVTTVSPLNELPLEPLPSDEGRAAAKPTPTLAEQIFLLQPLIEGRRRSTRPDVTTALDAAIKRGGAPNEILVACQAFYRLPASTKEGGRFANGAAVILRGDRWRDFLPTPEPPPAPPSRAEMARRRQHFTDTGEWKPHWGERPKDAA